MDEAGGTGTAEAVSFGRWMQTRREALDLTREDLATQVGCARITIAKIEHGERRPSRQVAERLADALAIPEAEQATFVQWARGLTDNTLPPLPAPTRAGAPALAPRPPASTVPPDPAPTDNLPAVPSSFLGRNQDLAQVRGLLWRADARLVTLTGPPGIGKTRLSLAVAAALRADFAEGVWFVPLAPVRDPALVAATVAQTLGLKETPGQPIEAVLQAHLRDKQLLLVLDNFEQVQAAGPVVAGLLQAAPQLKVLVSSRAGLQIYGEHEFPVPPLALPDLQALPPAAALAQVAGVALFVQRAQAVQPAFALTPANAPVVASICVRLEGLPLAIELAAARGKLFTPEALLARLDRRLALLVGGPQDRTPRQQTLRDAIAWSYDLLDEAEQTLFRRLGVFVGGWTLEAAEQVGSGQ